MIGSTLGHYRLIDRLGAGGMGEVYRARDDRLDRDVAVKVLPAEYASDPERLRRFEKEARAAGRLNHPSLLTVYDVGTDGGIAYLVTELLEGETLRERLDRGALPCSKAVELALGIVAGLAAAHDKGIVHRDLKPENLFVTEDGRIKILDFGLAKVAPTRPPDGETEAQFETAAQTEPGAMIGTLGYMAPEQIRGLALDHRADLFALGAILHEMLSGRRAFRRATRVDTMTAVLREDAPELPKGAGIPPALGHLVRRCLEKEPSERFGGTRDLGFALEAILASPVEKEVSKSRSDQPVAASGPKASPITSVAVLFFRDLANEGENDHLGVGLADAIITELARAGSLIVRPTAAIRRLQGRSLEPQQAGRELGVDAVVDGNFQRSGQRLRVTVQLLGSRDGRPFWGTKVDTAVEDVFEMQDEVSRYVAEALRVELATGKRRRARPGGDAYELCLKGKFHLFHENRPGIDAAVDCFKRASLEDPQYAPAWAGLASAYARLAFTFEPDGSWHERSQEMCDRAVGLDPDLAEAHLVRARLLWSPKGNFDHEGAMRACAMAIAAGPGQSGAYTWLGTVLFHVAMFAESSRALARAIEVDPDNWDARVMLATCRYLEGRYPEAAAILGGDVERSVSAWGRYVEALCDLQLGDIEAAAKAADREATYGKESVYFHTLRGLIAARRGDGEGAARNVELAVQHKSSFGHYHHAQYDVACIYAVLGDQDRALEWLGESAGNGFPCHASFAADRLLESLHGDERFQSLLGHLEDECDRYRRLYVELELGQASRPLADAVTISKDDGGSESAVSSSRLDSVAVLPFADMSPKKDQDHFCEGIAEELLNALARIGGLRVASRTSSFQFKKTDLDMREIGRRLDVSAVLEGSVRKAGDRLRVSAQLIGTNDGYQLWSERFDRELSDVFAIQDEIAGATAAALRGVLNEVERQSLKSPQTTFQAYDYYLRGRQYFYRGGRGFTVSALRMFERAIEIDTAYAMAYAGVADCSSFLYLYYESSERHRERADTTSRRAVELDATLPEAHAARGLALSLDRRTEESTAAFENAIRIDPRLYEARYLYARACFAAGRMEPAAQQFEEAEKLRPDDFRVPSLLAKAYRALGRESEAVQAHRRALAAIERHLESNPEDALALCLGACALIECGDRQRALDWAARAAQVADPLLYYVACCYSRAGDSERALETLEAAIDDGWAHWDWLRHDGDLDLVRSHPRFPEVVRLSAGDLPEGPPSVAVLPFADMSLEKDQDYFCEGLAEELINALTHIEGLRVASRSASFLFKGSAVDIAAVGKKLGVATVLEGSVRKAGEQLRVTVQLVNVGDGYHRWSRRFDRKLEDVFVVQDEIAQGVAAALRGVLSPDERQALRRPSTGVEAYEHYLRGRQHLHRFSRPGVESALRMFERAIEHDPGYAPAYAGVADSHAWLFEWWGGSESDVQAAERASRKALELAPELAEAYASRGFTLSLGRRYDEAAREFQEALRLNPKLYDALYYYGRTCFAQGDIERSAELFRKAGEVRREDFQSLILLGQSLRMLGREQEADEANSEGVRRAERRLELDPGDARALSLGANAVFETGDAERALSWSRRAIELHPEEQTALINGACLRARMGLKDEALTLLEKVFDRGWGKRDWIEHDPDYDSLRDNPRFQAMIDKLS